MMMSFEYLNHRGVVEMRTVDVISIDYLINPGYNYKPGYFLHGICQSRNAPRSFALDNISGIETSSPAIAKRIMLP